MNMSRIGITMGCPVGVGPELVLKYFQESGKPKENVLVLGDIHVLRRCSEELRLPCTLVPWRLGDVISSGGISVFEASHLPARSLEWGKPNAETGAATAEYIRSGVALLQDQTLSGIATCPISKFALQQAGLPFPGHTEMLARLTDSDNYAMMMAGARLRVTLVTLHCALADVAGKLHSDEILRIIRLTCEALLTDFNLAAPRIAVAGYNPHAGEQGLFGEEEERHILPAVNAAKELGIDVRGPFPPDTIFYQAAGGAYDAVVCMYHDQGLIPFKLLHFRDGVNVTLGLPVVRTSVDHGAAYDIAGKGMAAPDSLIAAVDLARTIAEHRKENREHIALPPASTQSGGME